MKRPTLLSFFFQTNGVAPVCHPSCLGWMSRLPLVAMAALAPSILMGCRDQTVVPNTPASIGSQTSPATFQFDDVTPASGVTFTYRNGAELGNHSILESLGGGVGLLDYDLDGVVDLVFAGGGSFDSAAPNQPHPRGAPSKLYKQSGLLQFQDVTLSAGLEAAGHYSHGVCAADVNEDGFPDLLISGFGGTTYWKNRGDGTFADDTRKTGLTDSSWSSSTAWGDLNGDGCLDLYVAHYVDWSPTNHPRCGGGTSNTPDVCPPRRFQGLDDSVYLANGDGTFREGTREVGLAPEGKGLGVILADLDHDLDLDVYVANDTVDNFLYLNDGTGQLKEVGLSHGAAVDDKGVPNGSMGVSLLDFDNNLLPDLWVANYEEELFALYLNSGGVYFEHSSHQVGLGLLGSFFVGFGTVTCDFDCDGDEDIAVANGHVVYHPKSGNIEQLPLLLTNEGSRRFVQDLHADGGYFAKPHLGRGLAAGDLDDDGDLDLVFVNSNEPAAILKNNSTRRGRPLNLSLVGTISNRDAIGTRCILKTRNGSQLRHRFGGGSYLSTSDKALHFGVREDDQEESIRIHWPSGLVEDFTASHAPARSSLIEGRGRRVE